MSGVVACPVCGSGNAVGAPRCWVCGFTREGDAATQPAPTRLAARRARPSPHRKWFAAGWTVMFLGIAFVAALVGLELLFNWPGLLVPYALGVLIMFAALGKVAHVTLRGGQGQDGTDVLQGVAMGLIFAGGVLAALALLFVAAIVLFLIVCFAILGGAIH